MSLATYRKKRRFARTPEPAGGRVIRRASGPLRYVMHKHDATRLHFDLRLEHGGVLLSWAVPKGAPLVAGGKTLAVRTEDHPLEYGDFEGVIPEGEYGGGTVMLWDRGTWEPEKKPAQALADGELTFTLRGAKLRGRWTLVRTSGAPRGATSRSSSTGSGKEAWLLIKRSDPKGEAQPILGEPELSAATGRTMAEIAASADRTWSSTAGELPRRGESLDSVAALCAKVDGARKAAQPKSLRPALPTLADAVPEGDEWLHEIELVGERILAFKEGARVTLRSRTGRDRTRELRSVAEGVRGFPAERAVLDGEAVVLGSDGRSDAAALKDALEQGRRASLSYFVFDLPACAGYDLTRAALADRKALLLRLFAIVGRDPVLRFADHIAGRGDQVLREACQLGLEGVVSKRADSRYVPGRSSGWVEVKCARAEPERDGRGSARAPARAIRRGSQVARGAAVVDVEGVRITHPDRLLYAEHGLTKADVARYCATVAPFLLPHVVERPLTLVRCPEGPTGTCFYQKHARPGMPDAIRRIRIDEQEESGLYVWVSDLEGLLSLVQFGVIEIHPWGSRVDKLDHPDRIVIDLDPDPSVPWREVVSTARAVRDMLGELGLEGFPRTTGGKGLHVVVPIERRTAWPQVKAFARNLVALLVRAAPSKYVLTASKAQRKGRIFLDYLRNDRGATAIASYCMRARPGAPVATPLRWEEVTDTLDPTKFTIPSVTERLARLRSDPWQGFFAVRQALTRAMHAAVR